MLRVIVIGLFYFTFHVTLFAQSLSETVQWETTLEAAKSNAQIGGKKIFLYFSGSDWCKPCIQLREKEINSQQFSVFAKNNLILLQADFPRLKKNRLSREQVQQNEALAEKYNSEGTFPLIVILDSKGNMLGKTGYREENPDDFVHRIQRLLIP